MYMGIRMYEVLRACTHACISTRDYMYAHMLATNLAMTPFSPSTERSPQRTGSCLCRRIWSPGPRWPPRSAKRLQHGQRSDRPRMLPIVTRRLDSPRAAGFNRWVCSVVSTDGWLTNKSTMVLTPFIVYFRLINYYTQLIHN